MPSWRFHTAPDRAAALRFFAGHDAGHALFHQVLEAVAHEGPFELTATKSRVALTARTRFAWCHEANDDGSIWLGFLLPQRVASPRLRSGPAGGRWSHHVKLAGPQDLDGELVAWLRAAYRWDVDGLRDAAPKAGRARPRAKAATRPAKRTTPTKRSVAGARPRTTTRRRS